MLSLDIDLETGPVSGKSESSTFLRQQTQLEEASRDPEILSPSLSKVSKNCGITRVVFRRIPTLGNGRVFGGGLNSGSRGQHSVALSAGYSRQLMRGAWHDVLFTGTYVLRVSRRCSAAGMGGDTAKEKV